jgi:transmembrane sensor
MIESELKSQPEKTTDQDIIREQAAYWLLEFDTEANTDTNVKNALNTQKFESWLSTSPQHQQIFEQMQALWSSVNPQQKKQKRSKQRKQIGTASLCVTALLLTPALPWQYWNADYSTAVGQVTTITLADGSSATLNTNSAINVYYQQGQRKLQLVRGEVFVDVKKQPQLNPFTVTTPQGNAQALGTRYSVKYSQDGSQDVSQYSSQSNLQSDQQKSVEDYTKITVFESKVQVSSTTVNDVIVLSKGQQATVNYTSIQQHNFELASFPQTPDWSNKRLVFNQASLSSVVARLNQYHSGRLTLQDDKKNSGNKLGERQFTGVLPTNDMEMAVNLLAETMNLQMHSISPYFIWLNESKNKSNNENN